MDIAACVQWMTPFAMTLRDVGPAELKFFSQIPTEDTHAIQTHSVDLNLLVCICPYRVTSCWLPILRLCKEINEDLFHPF